MQCVLLLSWRKYMQKLPDNWNTLTYQEKDIFFARYYAHYIRPGERDGLLEDAPDDIKKAYEEFMKENK